MLYKQIRHIDGSILFECEIEDTGDDAKNLGAAVIEAVKEKADLRGANLSGKYNYPYIDIDFSGFDLSHIDFADAGLDCANFSHVKYD